MRLDYRRHDFRLQVIAQGTDAQLRLVAPDGSEANAWVPAATLGDAVRGQTGPLSAALRASAVDKRLDGGPQWGVDVKRVTIEVGEHDWARIDWENLAECTDACIVRVSPVLPRVQQVPLTFPIRVLDVAASPVVAPALKQLFGDSDRSLAIVDGTTTPGALTSMLAPADWPSVDLLHWRTPDVGRETLPWLTRYLDRYRVRLLVLECDPSMLGQARWLAEALVRRGGPAVFVTGIGSTVWGEFYALIVHDRPLDWIRPHLRTGALFAGSGREELLRYSHLARAVAARAAVRDIVSGVHALANWGTTRLTGPQDVDELVRAAVHRVAASLRIPTRDARLVFSRYDPQRQMRFTSTIGRDLALQGLYASNVDEVFKLRGVALDHPPILEGVQGPVLVSPDELSADITASAVPVNSLSPTAAVAAVRAKLDSIAATEGSLRFDNRESEGMLPLAARVADARELMERLGRRPVRRPRAARHVNVAFYTEASDHRLKQLPPHRTRLRGGELVHLGVRIGARDRVLVSIGSTALIEELDRLPGGAWIEIGVTAYDFELLGEPVQPLLLPPQGESDLATFALRVPRSVPVAGVARVRVCLYYRNNVVQSFLVVARLAGAAGVADAGFARVLGVVPARVRRLGRPGYLTRLEYRLFAIGDAERAGPRALSIVANDNVGDKVLTLKGDELFVVRRDFGNELRGVSEALDYASEENGLPRFSRLNRSRADQPQRLLEALWRLGKEGWTLFDKLLPASTDQRSVLARLSEGLGVHAAHIDAKDVIPWAVLYDRRLSDLMEVDPDDPAAAPLLAALKQEGLTAPGDDATITVEKALCMAAMQSPDNTIPCGHRKDCLLHPEKNQRRAAQGKPLVWEGSVICPHRFWGFRVPIEVPAQQASDNASTVPPTIQTRMKAGEKLSFVAAFNPHLDRKAYGDKEDGTHRRRLVELADGARAIFATHKRNGPAAVRALLDHADPDIVYLYCHGLVQGSDVQLDFGSGKGNRSDALVTGDLTAGPWTHGPVVFLNGCGTGRAEPYRPSEFIRKFIQGYKASAVIGTEVTVREGLAREFAEAFFTALFAKGKPSEAMLEARRALLAQGDPLGLVYTLYGSIDLRRDKTS